MNHDIKNRLSAYGMDFVYTIFISLILSIGSLTLIGIMGFFATELFSYSSSGLTSILFIILGIFIFRYMILFSVGGKSTFSQTYGYKKNHLKVKSKNNLQLYVRWFIRTGLISLLSYIYFCLTFFSNNYQGHFNWFIGIYIAYIAIDGIIFLLTRGKITLTDCLLDTDVIETD